MTPARERGAAATPGRERTAAASPALSSASMRKSSSVLPRLTRSKSFVASTWETDACERKGIIVTSLHGPLVR